MRICLCACNTCTYGSPRNVGAYPPPRYRSVIIASDSLNMQRHSQTRDPSRGAVFRHIDEISFVPACKGVGRTTRGGRRKREEKRNMEETQEPEEISSKFVLQSSARESSSRSNIESKCLHRRRSRKHYFRLVATSIEVTFPHLRFDF